MFPDDNEPRLGYRVLLMLAIVLFIAVMLAACGPPPPRHVKRDPAVVQVPSQDYDYVWHSSSSLTEVTLPSGVRCVILDIEGGKAMSCKWN